MMSLDGIVYKSEIDVIVIVERHDTTVKTWNEVSASFKYPTRGVPESRA